MKKDEKTESSIIDSPSHPFSFTTFISLLLNIRESLGSEDNGLGGWKDDKNLDRVTLGLHNRMADRMDGRTDGGINEGVTEAILSVVKHLFSVEVTQCNKTAG